MMEKPLFLKTPFLWILLMVIKPVLMSQERRAEQRPRCFWLGVTHSSTLNFSLSPEQGEPGRIGTLLITRTELQCYDLNVLFSWFSNGVFQTLSHILATDCSSRETSEALIQVHHSGQTLITHFITQSFIISKSAGWVTLTATGSGLVGAQGWLEGRAHAYRWTGLLRGWILF